MFRCFLVFLCLIASQISFAEAKRVALVIGNNSYPNLPIFRQLEKAVNDARSMRDTLRDDLGFKVSFQENADFRTMNNGFKTFEAAVEPGDIVFLFFSGHGVSIGGENYLLPTNIPRPVNGEEQLLIGSSFGAEQLVLRLKKRGAQAIFVVLDACRDDPFESENGKAVGGPSGLTKMDAAEGVFILFAAGVRQEALDRLDDADSNPNSVFTRSLIPALKTAGLSQVDLAKRVYKEVKAAAATIGHDQTPAYYDQIDGYVMLKEGEPLKDVTGGTIKDDNDAQTKLNRKAQTDFVSAMMSNNTESLARFVDAYKNVSGQGDNIKLALLQIDRLKTEPVVNPDEKIAVNKGKTLRSVLDHGRLNCGVSQGLAGFSLPDANGNWSGLDVDTCKAFAVAIFGSSAAAIFQPLSAKARFTSLQSGEIDVLVRNSAFRKTREDMDLSFVGANFFDGQGFMVRKSLGIKSAGELNGATVCVQAATTTELALASYFKESKMLYNLVSSEKFDETNANYEAGRCDVLTTDASGLAALRAGFAAPDDHIILPERITDEKLGPFVRNGDQDWLRFCRLVLNALLVAEQLGINSGNVVERTKDTNPDVQRFFETENIDLGLAKGWTAKVISATGNYAEIFDRNLGASTPFKMERGLNALSRNGGLMVPELF